ncbi:MAG: hypothetical protein EOO65_01375 [Methanosarcinales archaeon]|nr:MAG: hypothetical protein EOO65_01375 [Methanosarcinales archaeon]
MYMAAIITYSLLLAMCRGVVGAVAGSVACSGHGDSTSVDTCNCHASYYGANCELQVCASGSPWFAKPSGDDDGTPSLAHATAVECSHQGVCNATTGFCTCFDGWTGSACDIRTCVQPRSHVQ